MASATRIASPAAAAGAGILLFLGLLFLFRGSGDNQGSEHLERVVRSDSTDRDEASSSPAGTLAVQAGSGGRLPARREVRRGPRLRVLEEGTNEVLAAANVDYCHVDFDGVFGTGLQLPRPGEYFLTVSSPGFVPFTGFVDVYDEADVWIQRGCILQISLVGGSGDEELTATLIPDALDLGSASEARAADAELVRAWSLARDLAAGRIQGHTRSILVEELRSVQLPAYPELQARGESGRIAWTALPPGQYRYLVTSPTNVAPHPERKRGDGGAPDELVPTTLFQEPLHRGLSGLFELTPEHPREFEVALLDLCTVRGRLDLEPWPLDGPAPQMRVRHRNPDPDARSPAEIETGATLRASSFVFEDLKPGDKTLTATYRPTENEMVVFLASVDALEPGEDRDVGTVPVHGSDVTLRYDLVDEARRPIEAVDRANRRVDLPFVLFFREHDLAGGVLMHDVRLPLGVDFTVRGLPPGQFSVVCTSTQELALLSGDYPVRSLTPRQIEGEVPQNLSFEGQIVLDTRPTWTIPSDLSWESLAHSPSGWLIDPESGERSAAIGSVIASEGEAQGPELWLTARCRPGVYEVYATAVLRGGRSVYCHQLLDLEDPDRPAGPLEFAEAVALQLRLLDPAGQPLPEVYSWFAPAALDGDSWLPYLLQARTDGEGLLELTGVEPGGALFSNEAQLQLDAPLHSPPGLFQTLRLAGE